MRCPNLGCQRVLAVPPNSRGKLVRCRGCGSVIQVPPKMEAPKPAPSEDAGAEEAA